MATFLGTNILKNLEQLIAAKPELQQALVDLHTDLCMLQDGSWEPDHDSVAASIANVEKVARILGVEVYDDREGAEL
jgi:hypothetical protein